ncbi:carbohydrate-binding module family 14 protein [Streptomyces sp. MZ04]|uniref:carbohydrate-binding module family 14 protein n=1 Tax=Streptomyces sp. MZ04 TaxID=2559236 RepID=UPI001433125E|nr:carbohydrate-binding module family 14 protein [Streptomyces sp. MZ04]
MIKVSRMAASALLAFGALCLPAYSATAQTLTASADDERCRAEDELLPNPDDAGSFFHCSHGVAYLKACPSILHFNPVLKVCDWPEKAGNPAADQDAGPDPS